MARLTVALTGGIASGKSQASGCFERLGIAVLDADRIARRMVARGQPALAAILARFGEGVLADDGELDRAALRGLVFADPAKRRDLEAILHPPIREALRVACLAATSAYAVAAIPLLAEGGGRVAYPWLDRILVIDVPRELQVQRLIARDGGTIVQADAILAAQATREQRLAIADDVIPNDGSPEALAGRVAELHELYLRLAARKA